MYVYRDYIRLAEGGTPFVQLWAKTFGIVGCFGVTHAFCIVSQLSKPTCS